MNNYASRQRERALFYKQLMSTNAMNGILKRLAKNSKSEVKYNKEQATSRIAEVKHRILYQNSLHYN